MALIDPVWAAAQAAAQDPTDEELGVMARPRGVMTRPLRITPKPPIASVIDQATRVLGADMLPPSMLPPDVRYSKGGLPNAGVANVRPGHHLPPEKPVEKPIEQPKKQLEIHIKKGNYVPDVREEMPKEAPITPLPDPAVAEVPKEVSKEVPREAPKPQGMSPLLAMMGYLHATGNEQGVASLMQLKLKQDAVAQKAAAQAEATKQLLGVDGANNLLGNAHGVDPNLLKTSFAIDPSGKLGFNLIAANSKPQQLQPGGVIGQRDASGNMSYTPVPYPKLGTGQVYGPDGSIQWAPNALRAEGQQIEQRARIEAGYSPYESTNPVTGAKVLESRANALGRAGLSQQDFQGLMEQGRANPNMTEVNADLVNQMSPDQKRQFFATQTPPKNADPSLQLDRPQQSPLPPVPPALQTKPSLLPGQVQVGPSVEQQTNWDAEKRQREAAIETQKSKDIAENNAVIAQNRLTDKQKQSLADADEQIYNVQSAIKAMEDNPGGFGVLRGLGTATPLTNAIANKYSSTGEIDARTKVFDVVSQIKHSRLGASMTPSEIKTVDSFLPSEYDGPREIKTKFLSLIQFINNKKAAINKALPEIPPGVGINQGGQSFDEAKLIQFAQSKGIDPAKFIQAYKQKNRIQ